MEEIRSMPEISFKYLVGEGEVVGQIIQSAKQTMAEHQDRVSQCIQKYGADCLWGGSRSAPDALGWEWEEAMKSPPPKEHFLKPVLERSGDTLYAIYRPDRRYKAGKAIGADLEAVGAFHYSDHVGKMLGIDRRVFGIRDGRQVVCGSSVGWYEDKLVARIPIGGEDKADLVIPEGFREVKKWEFVAITEKDC